MARPGPEQKPSKIGRTPNAGWTEVVDEPYDGPKLNLPKTLLGSPPLPQVVAWWDVISKMPHCRLWSASDWLYALDTAIQKQESYAGAAPVSLWSEIRKREDQMGTTVEARRKLGIRYVEPAVAEVQTPEQAASVASLDDRRSRLNAS